MTSYLLKQILSLSKKFNVNSFEGKNVRLQFEKNKSSLDFTFATWAYIFFLFVTSVTILSLIYLNTKLWANVKIAKIIQKNNFLPMKCFEDVLSTEPKDTLQNSINNF